ncbi:biotin-independent malonate decarboxylase subunit beta, partial [Pseudomonas otitidis]|nr:biotin-independent malonate decarboxylase subunit beta [Pseudomonas otitidis]
RCRRPDEFLARLARLGEDCDQLDAAQVRALYQGELQ